MKRRNFFKSIIGTAGALYFNPVVEGAESSLYHLKSGYKDWNKFKKWGITSPDNTAWRKLRKQFLIPSRYTYLNTGGLGASPVPVINRVLRVMESEEMYPSASHDEDNSLRIKEKIAAFLGRRVKPEQIAFTSTATEGINIIMNGIPFEKGDEIITSSHEHVAMEIPLLYHIKKDGIIVKVFEPDLNNANGNVEQIERLITPRTRLIFISHVTCTTGQIFPVARIGDLARSRNILFALDGAQAVGQLPFNIEDTNADFYVFSGHKWLLGPKRTGILYVDPRQISFLSPSIVGAFSSLSHDLGKNNLELHPTASRFEYGTRNNSLIEGLEEAIDFISTIGITNIWNHNRFLAELFLQELRKIPGITVLSPSEAEYRSSLITFKVNGGEIDKLTAFFKRDQIRCRVVSEAGLNAIRASFHVYNGENDLNKLVKSLKGFKNMI